MEGRTVKSKLHSSVSTGRISLLNRSLCIGSYSPEATMLEDLRRLGCTAPESDKSTEELTDSVSSHGWLGENFN